jgi:hypothetical protein
MLGVARIHGNGQDHRIADILSLMIFDRHTQFGRVRESRVAKNQSENRREFLELQN